MLKLAARDPAPEPLARLAEPGREVADKQSLHPRSHRNQSRELPWPGRDFLVVVVGDLPADRDPRVEVQLREYGVGDRAPTLS